MSVFGVVKVSPGSAQPSFPTQRTPQFSFPGVGRRKKKFFFLADGKIFFFFFLVPSAIRPSGTRAHIGVKRTFFFEEVHFFQKSKSSMDTSAGHSTTSQANVRDIIYQTEAEELGNNWEKYDRCNRDDCEGATHVFCKECDDTGVECSATSDFFYEDYHVVHRCLPTSLHCARKNRLTSGCTCECVMRFHGYPVKTLASPRRKKERNLSQHINNM